MNYEIPVYKIKLVRESHHTSERTITNTAEDAYQAIKGIFHEADREMVAVMMLDSRNKIIGIHIASTGSIDRAPFYPREIIKPAILSNASAIIVAHNHPSGDPSPSIEDKKAEVKLKKACAIFGITLHDSIIVGEEGKFYSMQKEGDLK